MQVSSALKDFKLQPVAVPKLGHVINVMPRTALSELSVRQLLGAVSEHKVIVLRGVSSPSEDEFLSFGDSFKRAGMNGVLEWPTGKVFHLQAKEESKNYIFSDEHVPLHWDGAFFIEPKILAFQCLEAPNPRLGGETFFADTSTVYNQLSTQWRDFLKDIDIVVETEKVVHYGGEVRRKLIQTDSVTQTSYMRFAESVETEKNPVAVRFVDRTSDKEIPGLEEILRPLFYQPNLNYQHTWQQGDIVLADNMRLVHGRRAFSKSSPRLIRRIQIH